MSASKMWTLAIGLAVVGVGLLGGTYWWQTRPKEPPRSPTAVYPTQRQPQSAALPATKPALPPAAKDAAKPAADAKSQRSDTPPGAEAGQDVAKLSPEPPKAAKPEPPIGKDEPPHFDVVRVEPSGDAVLAGKGAPNTKVALLQSGKPLAQAKTDATGNFVMLPPPLSPGDHDLTLRQEPDDATPKDSAQSVAVSVPKTRDGAVVVALAEPGKPTKVLSGPPAEPAQRPTGPLVKTETGHAQAPADTKTAPTPENQPKTPAESAAAAKAPSAGAPAASPAGPATKPARQPSTNPAPPAKLALARPDTEVKPPAAIRPSGPTLAFRTVELENGSGFFASGTAPPGTPIHIYLNDSHIAGVTAGPDGQWTLTIRKGLSSGHYIVRADATSADGRTVTARVEVPFDVPVAMAEAAKKPAANGGPSKVTEDVALGSSASAPLPPSAPNPSEVAGIEPLDADRPMRAAAKPAPPPARAAETAKPPPSPAATRPAAPAAASAPISSADAPPPPSAPSPSEVAGIGPAEPEAPAKQAEAPSAAPPQAATAAAAPSPAAVAAPTANAVIEDIETVQVIRGDNLWNISRTKLGEGLRYTQIYTANANQIRDPDLIYPGQVFVMPRP